MKKQQAKKTMLGTRGTAARRAVTLTELLVVLVIISLLATVAVPIYVSKVEQAQDRHRQTRMSRNRPRRAAVRADPWVLRALPDARRCDL